MSAHFCAFYQSLENPFRDVYRNRVTAGFVAVRVAGVWNERPVVGESLQTFAFEGRKAAYFAFGGDGVHARGVQRIQQIMCIFDERIACRTFSNLFPAFAQFV